MHDPFRSYGHGRNMIGQYDPPELSRRRKTQGQGIPTLDNWPPYFQHRGVQNRLIEYRIPRLRKGQEIPTLDNWPPSIYNLVK